MNIPNIKYIPMKRGQEMSEDEHKIYCDCKVCDYGRQVRKNLKGLSPDQLQFFREMYDNLVQTEFQISMKLLDNSAR